MPKSYYNHAIQYKIKESSQRYYTIFNQHNQKEFQCIISNTSIDLNNSQNKLIATLHNDDQKLSLSFDLSYFDDDLKYINASLTKQSKYHGFLLTLIKPDTSEIHFTWSRRGFVNHQWALTQLEDETKLVTFQCKRKFSKSGEVAVHSSVDNTDLSIALLTLSYCLDKHPLPRFAPASEWFKGLPSTNSPRIVSSYPLMSHYPFGAAF